MKKILAVAAALSLAALFTACDDSSSDSSNRVISCYSVAGDGYSFDSCFELELVDESRADEARKECEVFGDEIVSSCPSGAVKTCSYTNEEKTLISYYYTGADPNKACEDF